METIELQTIRQYICEELLFDDSLTIADDEDLLLSGLLDSMSIMRLVGWLENQANISITASDVVLENFGSLQQIVAFVERKAS